MENELLQSFINITEHIRMLEVENKDLNIKAELLHDIIKAQQKEINKLKLQNERLMEYTYRY